MPDFWEMIQEIEWWRLRGRDSLLSQSQLGEKTETQSQNWSKASTKYLSSDAKPDKWAWKRAAELTRQRETHLDSKMCLSMLHNVCHDLCWKPQWEYGGNTVMLNVIHLFSFFFGLLPLFDGGAEERREQGERGDYKLQRKGSRLESNLCCCSKLPVLVHETTLYQMSYHRALFVCFWFHLKAQMEFQSMFRTTLANSLWHIEHQPFVTCTAFICMLEMQEVCTVVWVQSHKRCYGILKHTFFSNGAVQQQEPSFQWK